MDEIAEEAQEAGLLRCALCGDIYHEEPDEQQWMGLRCPGANADAATQHQFITDLSEAYARWIQDLTHLTENRDEWLEQRKDEWYRRKRSDILPGALQDACDATTREVVAEIPWAQVNNETPAEKIIALIEADQAEEWRWLDMDAGHLLVPETPPATPVPTALTQAMDRKKETENDVMLYLGENGVGDRYGDD